jgi:transporter family protein
VALLDWAAFIWTGRPILSVPPVPLAAEMRTNWTLAIACTAYGMGVLKLPVSIIAPLTNSNALIAAVLVGAVAFSEWRNLNLSLVALSAPLICAGMTIISLSR